MVSAGEQKEASSLISPKHKGNERDMLPGTGSEFRFWAVVGAEPVKSRWLTAGWGHTQDGRPALAGGHEEVSEARAGSAGQAS